jgi:hypothetical protein
MVNGPWEWTSSSKLDTPSKLSDSLTYPSKALRARIGVRGLDNLVRLWQWGLRRGEATVSVCDVPTWVRETRVSRSYPGAPLYIAVGTVSGSPTLRVSTRAWVWLRTGLASHDRTRGRLHLPSSKRQFGSPSMHISARIMCMFSSPCQGLSGLCESWV